MKLRIARLQAEQIIEKLSPYCKRIEIAGSIRREKPEVGDIEILAVPDKDKIMDFCRVVLQWHKIKGHPTGNYTQRVLHNGMKLDLFMPREEDFGRQFAIRTGSVAFSKKFAYRWVSLGWKGVDGILTNKATGETKTFLTEEEFFEFLGMPFIHPRDRR